MISGEGEERNQADRWLGAAERDLAAAHWLCQGGFFNSACFQAHQAAVKALKASLLTRSDEEAPTQSCLALLDSIIRWLPDLERVRQHCRVLDRHYILSRYPDALPGESPEEAYGPEDADDAIGRAEKVLSAIISALGTGRKGTNS